MMNGIQNISNIFSGICQQAWFKCFGAFAFMTYNFAFNVNQKHEMLAVLMLIIFDFFTAVMAAKKTGKPIKSANIFKTPLKIVVYFMLISGGHLADVVIQYGSVISGIVIAFLGLTEFISVLENIGKMGYAIPKKLLNQLEKLRDEKEEL